MNRRHLLALTTVIATGLAALPALAQDGPVQLGIVAEMSGTGAPSGTNWEAGARLAIDEINADGGILGRQIEATTYDTQTDPLISRALIQKAIDADSYVVLGTIYSSSTVVNMLVAMQNGVPQFTGAEAPAITQKGNPYIFRTSMGAQQGIPSLTKYFVDDLGVQRVAIAWVNNEFGKGGREVFMQQMEGAGIEVVEDIASEPAQTDYGADVARLKASDAEAVFVYLHQEESARFLVEAQKQGLTQKLIGETTLNDQKVIELAGTAANGAVARVNLPLSAPQIVPVAERFEEKYGYKPIQDAIKGYIAVYTTKYVTELVGDFDREAFAQRMHGLCLPAAEYPGVLIDTCWDDTGEMSRASFMVEVQDGESIVLSEVPAP